MGIAPTYQETNYDLYCGDSRVILQEINDGSIGLSVFSPPYYNSIHIDYDTQNGNIEYSETWDKYCDALVDVCRLVYDKLVAGGRLCLNVDDKHVSPKVIGRNICLHTHARLIEECVRIGFDYKGSIIWQKIRSAHASGGASMMLGSYPFPSDIPIINNFEYILVFRKPGKRVVEPAIREASRISRQMFNMVSEGIWQLNGVRDKLHPAPFPIDIPARLIQLFSFVGDIILDPFCGISTTGMAAISLGRRFIGIDISENYIRESHLRLSQLSPMFQEPIPIQGKMFHKI